MRRLSCYLLSKPKGVVYMAIVWSLLGCAGTSTVPPRIDSKHEGEGVYANGGGPSGPFTVTALDLGLVYSHSIVGLLDSAGNEVYLIVPKAHVEYAHPGWVQIGRQGVYRIALRKPDPAIRLEVRYGPDTQVRLNGVPFWDGERILVEHYVSPDLDGLFVDPAMIVKHPIHLPSDD